jgi:hypothetical protein
MKKILIAAMVALVAPAAAFADHDTISHIGTIVRECHDEYSLAVENCHTKINLRGAVCRLEGKRVEIYGQMERDTLCVTAVYELLPRGSDLVVSVDVRYRGNGETFVGYQPAGCFDPKAVRFARPVHCGERVEVRIPVRRDEAHIWPGYQVVMWAVEKLAVGGRCSSNSGTTTVVRHELSGAYTYLRGKWRDGCRRKASAPRITLCL